MPPVSTSSTAPQPAAIAGSSSWLRRWRHLDKSVWVWALAICVLLVLVVNPLARLLIVSFPGCGRRLHGLGNYAAAYSRSRYIDALTNSLVLGASAASLCIAFGVPMAWALSRTDMRFKGLIWVCILGTFIIPHRTWARSAGSCWLARTRDGSIARSWR